MSKLNLVAEPGTLDIRMSREFNAPRELVFKACTDPELVARWWGQASSTTIVDKMEVKPGGIWRYVQREADGSEYGFFGVYHQVTPPERLVYTFEFEGMPGHILLETIDFVEENGKTRLIDTSVFQSVEDRDGMIASGMEGGATESWDQLDDLLKSLQ
ncbi:MAG: ATPase [Anaerolineaceae bacterium]|nr:ATPase [Anaerolineaceae bacterium]